MTTLKAVSLFTGAGGLDLGLEQAFSGELDFQAWVENDSEARATLSINNVKLRDCKAAFGDITSVNPVELMRAAHLREGELFLLAGGPPCQAFSTAGLRQGVNGSGSVVHNYFSMVEHLQPRFFVFENVRGLLSAALVHRPLTERQHPQEVPDDEQARLGSVLNLLILPTFKRLGYEVVFGILNAADYGSAQVRHRVFILGSRDHEFRSVVFRKQTSRPMMALDLVPATHHRYAPYPPLGRWRTLRDAIAHLQCRTLNENDSYRYSPERAAIFERIPAGKNWKYVRDNPEKFPRGYLSKIMGNAIDSGGGKEGFWRRLSWDTPTPTLTAQPQQLASSLCHPEHLRPLSIPEYAALQDFPDTYRFVGSKAGRYRQIGNAVPGRLGAAVGRALLAISQGRVDQLAEQDDDERESSALPPHSRARRKPSPPVAGKQSLFESLPRELRGSLEDKSHEQGVVGRKKRKVS